MIGMTKSLAQEIASAHVTVNCIAPGFIATAMTDKLNDKQQRRDHGRDPDEAHGRRPARSRPSAVYLARDEAGYVTGQTLHVNGGMAMI